MEAADAGSLINWAIERRERDDGCPVLILSTTLDGQPDPDLTMVLPLPLATSFYRGLGVAIAEAAADGMVVSNTTGLQ